MPPSPPRLTTPSPNPRDPSNWGVNADTHTLPLNADVRVNRDRVGRVVGAWREDVFGRLFARGKGGSMTQPDLDAVRRLQRDLAIRGRVAGASDSPERVDGGERSGLDNAVDAGRRVDAVLAKLPPRDRALLEALCNPLSFEPWRATVQRLTAQTGERAQVRVVRHVARLLANAYGYPQPTDASQRSLGEMNAPSR